MKQVIKIMKKFIFTIFIGLVLGSNVSAQQMSSGPGFKVVLRVIALADSAEFANAATTAQQFLNFQDSLLTYARRMDTSTDSLVLALFFDDEATGYLDFSGQNNHGTNSGAVIRTDPDSFIVGGGAAAFDGTASYINIDNTLTNSLANTAVGTWRAWVKLVSATSGTQYIISFGDTDQPYKAYLGIGTTGRLFAQIAHTTVRWILNTDNTVFFDNTWARVGITQDGTEAILYFNGIAVAQAFSISTDIADWLIDVPTLDNGRIGIGSWSNDSTRDPLNGIVDEVTIDTRALTADEMLSDYLNSKHFSDRMKKLNSKGLVTVDSVDVGGAVRLADGAVTIDETDSLFTAYKDILISGNDLWITDATGADSVRIYDDGDTTRFESDNPIKVGNGSIIISGDSVVIGGDLVVEGSFMEVTNAHIELTTTDSVATTISVTGTYQPMGNTFEVTRAAEFIQLTDTLVYTGSDSLLAGWVFGVSASSGTATNNASWQLFINSVNVGSKGYMPRGFKTANSEGYVGGNGIIALGQNDSLWIHFTDNKTATWGIAGYHWTLWQIDIFK